MKRCPACNRTYTDPALNFCLEDGTPLINESAPGADPNATVKYTIRDTNPPATEIFPSLPSAATPPPPAPPPPQWSPPPSLAPRKKSNALWWIVGGVLVAGVIGVGLIIMIIALASMGSNANNRNASNANSRISNRNANTNVNVSNSNLRNMNSDANLPASVADDFSEAKWGAGNYSYGDIWYDNNEYHMRAKEKSYLVMYAPDETYNTDNANVTVNVRSVDGSPSPTGFGLIVHGERSKSDELEDYAFLIYTGENPQYEIVKHKGGEQTAMVPWSKSSAIRTGSEWNKLEIRARGAELSFYINGQYVDRITDSENFRRGLAGLYTSDTVEVAFDDLEIKR